MKERLGNYPVEKILELVIEGTEFKDKPKRIPFGDYEVKMNSQRLETFKKKGIVCKKCGLEATYFGLDLPLGSNLKYPHFNLYTVKDGEEILFTKDHIFPLSKGGKNTIDNYQTMCQQCNVNKGVNYSEDDFDIQEDGKVYFEGILVGDIKHITKRPKRKKKKKKKPTKKK